MIKKKVVIPNLPIAFKGFKIIHISDIHSGSLREVAMTGEITLKGRVLPIGGLKEKLLAAIRYGIKTVIIPKENEKDLIEIQKDIQNKLTIKKVEFAREVLDIALDGKINKINKKLDWRHIVSESMKQKNQQNQEKSY